jgi:YVTN family beta-propeller protein
VLHRALTFAVRFAALTLLLASPVVGQPPEPAPSANRWVREDIAVEFSARPVGGQGELREGNFAEVEFRITDAATGRPLRSLAPGAWMDIGQPVAAREKAPLDCRQKMSLYLSGRIGIRPMLDLNSYFVLTLNRESSISVVDPYVGMPGKTYVFAHIPLSRPGADWAKTADHKRLFVTIPRSREVAVVDTEGFKVSTRVPVGGTPMRIVLQGDGRYLWVGDDSAETGRSGVVVIEAGTLEIAGRIPTGRGHHEIALSPDDRWAFVSNRDEGTVSVIDVARLAKIKDVKTGPQPIALAYSRSNQALYVADGKSGEIAVLDGRRHEVAARIAAKPGLGPMRFTEDGRWGFVVNSEENAVHIVDSANNRMAHTVRVGGRPYSLALTRAFAYVRSLDSAQVSMIPLSEVGREQPPAVKEFAAGTERPGAASGIAVAGPIVPAVVEAAVMVANPADGNVYFYMEGMMAPMATFRNWGHRPSALEVVNRSLKEIEPGVYQTTVRLPLAGKYDVGFVLNSPRLLHCFVADVALNPALARRGPPLEIEYLVSDRRVSVGGDVTLAFKLTDAATQRPRTGLGDVRVVYYMAPGRERIAAPVREVADGVYETTVTLREAGAYYVYVAVPSVEVQFADLPFLSLIAETGGQPVRGRAAN